MFFIYAAIMCELFFFFNVVFFAFSLCLCPTFQHGCAFFIERIALRFVVWGNWRKCCTTLTRRGRCFLFRFLSGSLQWRAILGHFKWHWGIYHMHHRMPKVPMLLVWASWWYHCLQVCVLSSCLFFFFFFNVTMITIIWGKPNLVAACLHLLLLRSMAACFYYLRDILSSLLTL